MDQFKVVYTGKLQPKAIAGEVIKNVSMVFKISHEKAEKLVRTQQPRVISKSLAYEKAQMYQKKLEQIGLQVEIIQLQEKPVNVSTTDEITSASENIGKRVIYKCLCKATNKESGEPRYSHNWVCAKRAMFKIYENRIECGQWIIQKNSIKKAHLYHAKQCFVIPGNILKLETNKECYQFAFNPWAKPFKHLGLEYSESKIRLKYSLYSIAIRVLLIACVTLGFFNWDMLKKYYVMPIGSTEKVIEPIESLKEFIADGQEKGFFPSKIFSNGDLGPVKLQDVTIDFRTIIDWVDGATCTQHSDQIILATSEKNQSVECGFGDTVTLLGSGDDWVEDAWGNDIVIPGGGNDTIDLGYGNDIVIFQKNWGHDTVKIHSKRVNKKNLDGYLGGYPWEFSSFIIFGEGVLREDIVWKKNQLVNTVSGDTITLNTKDINILFASSPASSMIDNTYIPELQEPEKIDLKELNAESILVNGNIAYYAKGNDGLYIVDITLLESPTILSKTLMPGRAMSVHVLNGIAYISQVDSGKVGKSGWVSIVDVKNPQQPKIITTIPFGAGVFNVAVTEKFLYVPESKNRQTKKSTLHIYSLKNPRKPKLISTTELEHYTQYIAYLDETLYLSRKSRGIQVFDVRKPKKPKMTAEYGLGKALVRSIKAEGNKIVVNQDDNNFIVLAPTKRKKLYTFCKMTTPKGNDYIGSMGVDSIWIRDNIVFRAEGRQSITVSDISNKDNCRVIDSIPLGKQWVSSVAIAKNTLIGFSDNKGSSLYNLDEMYPKYKLEETRPKDIEKNEKKSKEETKVSSLSEDQLQKLLYEAASSDDAEQVSSLCKQGAQPNVKGHLSHKPIEISAMLGRLNSLKALLECPGKPTPKSMLRAALNEEFEAMKMLESYGGDIGQKDGDGCTTLHYLAQDGTLDMVQYLVEKGVPVNATCRGGETALKWAHYGKNKMVIEYLSKI